jgi:hypothetical protein
VLPSEQRRWRDRKAPQWSDSNRDEQRICYKVERSEWSKGLDIALDRFEQIDSVDEDLTDYGKETATQSLH